MYLACMDDMIDISIPVDAETAKLLESPARREAAGRYLSGMVKSHRIAGLLAEAIAELKREAHANGLTDEMVDAEIEAWREERRS